MSPSPSNHDNAPYASSSVEPPNRRGLEARGPKEGGSSSSKHKQKHKSGQKIVGGAKRVKPDGSQDLTPAPEAKAYWTWDEERKQYYHVDAQTGEREYYHSDSEGEK